LFHLRLNYNILEILTHTQPFAQYQLVA